MRRRLKFDEIDYTDENNLPMNVIIRQNNEIVSLLVDKIGDVIEVDSSTFEATPNTLSKHVKGVVSGIHKLDDDLLLVLKADEAVDVSKFDA